MSYWRWVLADSPFWRRQVNGRDASFVITEDTELLIDGYPNSGVRFAASAFQSAQDKSVSVAYGSSSARQIVEGVQREIPCLLIVREPLDSAISSFVATRGRLAPEFLLGQFLKFYRKVTCVLDEVVVASFKQVQEDFGFVIFRLNSRFGTEYSLFESTPENIESVLAEIDSGGAVPGEAVRGGSGIASRKPEDHAALKQKATVVFEAPRIKPLIAECQQLYEDVVRQTQIAATGY